jgi:hypothetical protein
MAILCFGLGGQLDADGTLAGGGPSPQGRGGVCRGPGEEHFIHTLPKRRTTPPPGGGAGPGGSLSPGASSGEPPLGGPAVCRFGLI